MTELELAKKILAGGVPESFIESYQSAKGKGWDLCLAAEKVLVQDVWIKPVRPLMWMAIFSPLFGCLGFVAFKSVALLAVGVGVAILTTILASVLSFISVLKCSIGNHLQISDFLKDLELAATALNRSPEGLLDIARAGKWYIPEIVDRELKLLGAQIDALQRTLDRDRLNPSDGEKELVNRFRDGYPALELLGLVEGPYGKYFPN